MNHGRAVCSEYSWNRAFIHSLLGVPPFACSLHVVSPVGEGFIMVDKSLKVRMELLGANQKLLVDLFSSHTHHYFWKATSSTCRYGYVWFLWVTAMGRCSSINKNALWLENSPLKWNYPDLSFVCLTLQSQEETAVQIKVIDTKPLKFSILNSLR